ncbi:MAG TPA: carbon monoxide dehydrogenase subunit G [Usitatibacter sp.]|nr:carbon monoxide dehydrogenase subunit G [Usitatibacter sp.]
MEMTGQRTLAVERRVAWTALNDPETIRQSIPGCESMERHAEGHFVLAMKVSLGPVNAKFRGRIWLEDVVELQSYTLNFSGDGVTAGFANGSARVTLADDGTVTVLAYEVTARIGGRLAQIGSRLVDSAARKMADDFFARFEKVVTA